MFETLAPLASEHMPVHKPRYLMGVGNPTTLVRAVACGVDMFDCVLPTRTGRMGTAFSSTGRMNMRNASTRTTPAPLTRRAPARCAPGDSRAPTSATSSRRRRCSAVCCCRCTTSTSCSTSCAAPVVPSSRDVTRRSSTTGWRLLGRGGLLDSPDPAHQTSRGATHAPWGTLLRWISSRIWRAGCMHVRLLVVLEDNVSLLNCVSKSRRGSRGATSCGALGVTMSEKKAKAGDKDPAVDQGRTQNAARAWAQQTSGAKKPFRRSGRGARKKGRARRVPAEVRATPARCSPWR